MEAFKTLSNPLYLKKFLMMKALVVIEPKKVVISSANLEWLYEFNDDVLVPLEL